MNKDTIVDTLFDVSASLFLIGMPVQVNLLFIFGPYIPEEVDKTPFLIGTILISLLCSGVSYRLNKNRERISKLEEKLERLRIEVQTKPE